MLDGPVFSEPLSSDIAGDDPLGIAPTSERLYGDVFPGVNNVVRYVRVYAAICWIVWRVELHFEALGTGLTTQVFDDAMQKMEIALCWANQDKGYTQIAGINRRPVGSGPQKLVFSSFGQSAASLLQAVNYRPSLTNGLKFLEAKMQGTLQCTPAGLELACAFDTQARSATGYAWLKDVTQLVGRPSDVAALASVLDVGYPSPAEQAAFLAQFFPSDGQEGIDQSAVNRALAIRLMLRSVDGVCRAAVRAGKLGWASEDEIRVCMARARASDGESLNLAAVSACQATWAVLQVRQLQRLAIDSLYCVVESWIDIHQLSGEDTGIDACARAIGGLAGSGLDERFATSLSELLEHLRGLQGERQTLFDASCRAPDVEGIDVFAHIRELLGSDFTLDSEGASAVPTSAYVALLACAVEVENLLKFDETREVLQRDRDTCSLLALRDLVNRYATTSSANFITFVVAHWVVLRHFQVVADRSRNPDGKNRFRFVVGDHGLERFDPSAGLPTPPFAQDRLQHMLALSAQCGLLDASNDGYRLTAYGRARMS